MTWRNIEIDDLIIGYLLIPRDDRASDQLLPPVSGRATQGCSLTRLSASIHRVHQQPTRRPHELAAGAAALTDTRQVI